MKLQYRVPLLIIGTMMVTGLVTGALMLYFQRKSAEDQFGRMAETFAGEVRSNLEHEMLEGADRAHVEVAMDRIRAGEMLNEVVIYSRSGEIFSSGYASEVGRYRDDPDINKVLQTGTVVKHTTDRYGRPELGAITPIFNKPACYACHGSDHAILGAIEVGIDTSTLAAQQREQTVIMGVLGGLTFLLVGGMVTYTLRRMVFNPLSRLGATAQRISAGDYTARSNATGTDEVGVLGSTFNAMAQRVQRDNEELAHWNAELEQRVEQRTRELSALNEMSGQLMEKLISAQEEERKRIARELHDQTSQSLTSLIVGLKNLETSSKDRKLQRLAAALQSMSLQALDEVHRLSVELRPAALDELGLVAALRSHLKESSQRFNINIDFTTVGLQKRPAPVVETTIYRIVQEAVTNVAKHARASNITVNLERHDGAIIARVEDDGVGFEVRDFRTPTVAGKGLGLLGMSERAILLGGKFSVESAPGHGTRLLVEIPLGTTGDSDA